MDFWLCKVTRGAYLRNRRPPKRILAWDLNKVPSLIKSPRFSHELDPYDLMRKSFFLVALAPGNEVSELANLDPSSLNLQGPTWC